MYFPLFVPHLKPRKWTFISLSLRNKRPQVGHANLGAGFAQMRKQKQRLSSENFRLRNKLAKVEQQLKLERMLAMRLHTMLQRASVRLSAISELLSGLFKSRRQSWRSSAESRVRSTQL